MPIMVWRKWRHTEVEYFDAMPLGEGSSESV